ncbi:MAG: NADH-quinone oxidoreductase subunit L [Anaerolineales bacterium]
MFLSEIVTQAPEFFALIPLIVFFPVTGLLINAFFGGRMSEKAIGMTACAASGLSFLIAVLMGVSLLGHPEGTTVPFLDWITIGDLQVEWAFRVDTLSTTMMLVVTGVGTLIHIYAIGYMHEDVRFKNDPGRYQRFFVFFNLFIAAMMILVTGDNYMMLFVGWEGVGLCSYLLIGFWYDKDLLGRPGIDNALAGSKAFITNRVGDFGFLMAAFTMFWTFRTVRFTDVFAQVHHIAETQPGAILAITLFMLLGVTGKSAQLPLYVWLPDAMAGPTPVSALIHAATMVTAGVYLVARSAPLYTAVPTAQAAVALVGGLTALFAATIAVGQYDLKKVLAYSTISQLGFMVAAVGMGAFVAGMFHLVTHAFFKALLFLSAGSVILGIERGHHHLHHDHEHEEEEEVFDPGDMRNMGGLRKQLPTTFKVFLVGAIALSGIPPFAGFFSKDEILAEATKLNFTVYILLAIAAFFTAFYMGRQVWMVFFGDSRHPAAEHAEESPPVITVPLIILAGLATLGGALNLPSIHTFGHWLEHTFETFHVHLHAAEFNLQVAAISTLLALSAITLAWLLYGRKPLGKGDEDPLSRMLGPIFTGMNNKWWVDELYEFLFINRYIDLTRILSIHVDWNFWHDWFHEKVIAGGYVKVAKFLSTTLDWDFWHNWFHDKVIADGYVGLTKFLSTTLDWDFWHDWFHDQFIGRMYRQGARILAQPIDLGFIDGIANGLAEFVQSLSNKLRKVQTGFVRNYALSVFTGVILILGYLLLH